VKEVEKDMEAELHNCHGLLQEGRVCAVSKILNLGSWDQYDRNKAQKSREVRLELLCIGCQM
jgi:hypothetical protein